MVVGLETHSTSTAVNRRVIAWELEQEDPRGPAGTSVVRCGLVEDKLWLTVLHETFRTSICGKEDAKRQRLSEVRGCWGLRS